jgi:hypothetical protein
MQPAAANPILTIPDGTVFSKGDELYDKRFRERLRGARDGTS